MLSRNNHTKQPHFINVFGFPKWVKCWLDKILKCSKVQIWMKQQVETSSPNPSKFPRRCDAKRRHKQTPKISLQLAAKKSWEFRKMTKMRSLKKLPGRSHLSIISLQDFHLAANLQRIEDWYWFSVTLCPSKKCFRHGNCHARLVFFKAIGWNIRLVVAFNIFVKKTHSKKTWELVSY